MTAAGFVLFALGGALFGLFEEASYGWKAHAKTVGSIINLAGAFLLVVVVAVWLWREMP